MEKTETLPAISKNPKIEQFIRRIYKNIGAKALSDVAADYSCDVSEKTESLAERIAAELVVHYLSEHLMFSTVDSLERETKNRIRQRHNENYISQCLKLAKCDTYIEGILAQPAERVVPTSPKTVVQTPPPKLILPITTTEETCCTSPGKRKIHVKVKKRKDGTLLEDPKAVMMKPGVLKRISKKDRDYVISLTRTETYSPTKQTETANVFKKEYKGGNTTIDTAEPVKKKKRVKVKKQEKDSSDGLATLVYEELLNTKPEISLADRIKQQINSEVDNNSKNIEKLEDIIKEKDEKERTKSPKT